MSFRPLDEARPRREARPGSIVWPARPGRGQATTLLVVLLSLASVRVRPVLASSSEGRIELLAPSRCGSADDLGRRVSQRSPRVRLSADGDGNTMVRVTIESSPGASVAGAAPALARLLATLTVRQGSAAPWSRRVHSATCDEALDALALILALALDPARAPPPSAAPASSARPPVGGRIAKQPSVRRIAVETPETATPSAAPAAAAPPAPAAPAAPATSTVRAVPGPAADAPAASAPSDVALAADVTRSVDEPPASWRWSAVVGAAGAVTTVPAPSVMPGAGVYATLRADRGSLWSPAIRLAFSHFWASRFVTEAGTARFTADVATVDLCPLWAHGGAWALGGCAAVTAGLVTGQGADTFGARSRRRPFLAPGGSAVITFEPPASNRAHLQIAMWANAAMPLIRDRFQFEPQVFYQVPRLSLTAGVAVGWRFW